MIENIIFVEEGSIDLDKLIESFSEKTKIITYKQGTKPPIIQHLEVPIESKESNTKKNLAVDLPCSIGDPVYVLHGKMIRKLYVKGFSIYSQDGLSDTNIVYKLNLCNKKGFFEDVQFSFDFNRLWFLTKEEAQQEKERE